MAFLVSSRPGSSSSVNGPGPGAGVSTLNALPRWGNTTGTTLKNSGAILDDSDNLTGIASLTVTTLVATTTITTGDNLIVLNDDVVGAPTEDAGLEINRGASTDAHLLWDETNDYWVAGLAGSPAKILLAGDDHGLLSGLGDDDHTQYHTNARALTWLGTRSTADLLEGSNLYFTDERAQDAVGTVLTDSAEIDFTYNDGAPSITADLLTTGVSAASYGSATQVAAFTVDTKGRLSAASNVSIQIAESQVTNLVSDLAAKQPTITVGALDGQAANAQGLSLTSNVLYQQSASVSNPGLVNTATQNFAGTKSLTKGMVGTTTSNANVPFAVAGQQTIVAPPANTIFHVSGTDGAQSRLTIDTFNNTNAFGSAVQARRARGTAGTPSAALLDDVIFQLAGIGYGATAFGSTSVVSVALKAAENFTDSAQGSYIQMSTTPTGSTASAVGFKLNSNKTVQLSGYGEGYAFFDSTGLLSSNRAGFTISTITGNTTAAHNVLYLLDSSGGIFNLTLPSPVNGTTIRIKCKTGSCETNPVTIVRFAAESIEGLAASYEFRSNWGSLTIVADGTNWFFI